MRGRYLAVSCNNLVLCEIVVCNRDTGFVFMLFVSTGFLLYLVLYAARYIYLL